VRGVAAVCADPEAAQAIDRPNRAASRVRVISAPPRPA
jgi:hypothetical protein